MKEKIAKILIDIEAVKLSVNPPFTWASGIKSPIYCDNRVLLGFPDERDVIIEEFCKVVSKYRPDIIAGTATAGIPHASWIADHLHLPMIYVRNKPKDHGMQNLVEGPYTPGKTVVVIEDLISTGMSSLAVADALKKEGLKVISVLSIFTYQLNKAIKSFFDAGISTESLTNFETLISVAVKEGALSPDSEELVLSWYKNPETWLTK